MCCIPSELCMGEIGALLVWGSVCLGRRSPDGDLVQVMNHCNQRHIASSGLQETTPTCPKPTVRAMSQNRFLMTLILPSM